MLSPQGFNILIFSPSPSFLSLTQLLLKVLKYSTHAYTHTHTLFLKGDLINLTKKELVYIKWVHSRHFLLI